MVKVSRRPESAPPREPGRRRARRAAWALLLAGVAGLAALALASGPRSALLRETGASSLSEAARAAAMAPVRIARAWVAGIRVPALTLDVKFEDLHRLHEKRDEALRTGVLEASDADLVRADVGLGDQKAEAQLRLDGAAVEPLRGERWPLMLQLHGDGQILGMRSFTLREPEAPAFRGEASLLAHARLEGIVTVRTALVELTLNGRRLGLVEIADVPAAELFESQQRREGPVLRFERPPPLDAAPPVGAPLASALRPGAIERSKKLSRQRDTALRLLRAALSGAAAPSDVFDPVLFARFVALAELWDAPHALAWRNVLLYANPLTARFEPVVHPCAPAAGSEAPDGGSFRRWLLSDPTVRTAYVAERSRLAGDLSTGTLASELVAQAEARARVLDREHPLRTAFDPASLLADAPRSEPRVPEVGAPRVRPAGADDEAELPLASPGLDALLARHGFLRWDAEERMLIARPGRWDVDGWLILPEGAGLRLPAGTTLHFERRRGIIARGPLDFLGAPDAPIVLEGPSDVRESEMWAGVYVVESERPSRWTHVTVRDTGGFRRHGWRLEGGVVFRKARVEIEDSTFRRNRSDDSLNLVRASFRLQNVTIVDSQGDAFDGDYVEGEIAGGLIEGAGGDAIDVGGSKIVVHGVRIENVRDKGIVVGEHSRAAIEDVTIEHAGTGVASKNGSETTLRRSSIDDVGDVALTAYMNHAEYGPGGLVADGIRITRAALPALAQDGSHVTIDGEAIPTVDAAVDRLYKDGETDR